MTGWLLNLVYGLLLVLTAPVWIGRMLRLGKYRRDWPERLGKIPVRYGLGPIIWVHGVSVGEVGAAKALVEQIHQQMPDYQVVISSTTDTGMVAAAKLFAPAHKVFRWPLDLTFIVQRALNRLRPALVVLMEGDVWPNFVAICRARQIPVVVVNARLGPQKGYPRYKLIQPLARAWFNNLAAIGVQHQTYADMFASLGVAPGKLRVTGMMKYDTAPVSDTVAGQEMLAGALGIDADRPLLVAGGTGAGEEALVLDAFARLAAAKEGDVRLAIIPRKPERFDEVAALIAQRGFEVLRRTRQPDGSRPPAASNAVILGDTMGELRKFYALSLAAFVGRSLVHEGGSDMIEAAALGRPVCFGPHTFNFPQAQSLVEAGGAVRVQDAGELTQAWERWLVDPDAAAGMGRVGRQFVAAQRGATARNVEMICRILGRTPAASPGDIATDVIR
jgi:3-deoxy-D-manno-octulosonic-acid transferase